MWRPWREAITLLAMALNTVALLTKGYSSFEALEMNESIYH